MEDIAIANHHDFLFCNKKKDELEIHFDQLRILVAAIKYIFPTASTKQKIINRTQDILNRNQTVLSSDKKKLIDICNSIQRKCISYVKKALPQYQEQVLSLPDSDQQKLIDDCKRIIRSFLEETQEKFISECKLFKKFAYKQYVCDLLKLLITQLRSTATDSMSTIDKNLHFVDFSKYYLISKIRDIMEVDNVINRYINMISQIFKTFIQSSSKIDTVDKLFAQYSIWCGIFNKEISFSERNDDSYLYWYGELINSLLYQVFPLYSKDLPFKWILINSTAFLFPFLNNNNKFLYVSKAAKDYYEIGRASCRERV